MTEILQSLKEIIFLSFELKKSKKETFSRWISKFKKRWPGISASLVQIMTHSWPSRGNMSVCRMGATWATSSRRRWGRPWTWEVVIYHHLTINTSYQPNTIQHVPIRVNPDIEIRSQNVMKVSYLLISKEAVWLPDLTHIRQCQVFDLICIGIVMSRHQRGNVPAPSFCLNCNRGSFHICLSVIWNLYSSW